MIDIAIGVGFVFVTLILRWLMARQMAGSRKVLLSADEACKQLARELQEIRFELAS